MKSEIIQLIIDTVNELVEQDELEIGGEVTADTLLFGREGILDSMGLVSTVIAVEQAIEEKFNTSISLADEKALSQKNSPYRTVTTLAEYAMQLVNE
jgi:acyl carrier protein